MTEQWPDLEYASHDALVVDRAWAESEQGQRLLEIEGCFFTLPLSIARRAGGRKVDEGDLLRTEREQPLPGAWPLKGAIHTRFQLMLRTEKKELDRVSLQQLRIDCQGPGAF